MYHSQRCVIRERKNEMPATRIDVSRTALIIWLQDRPENEVVGYLGQNYSNPVCNWLREQVDTHVKSMGGIKWNMGVGIRGNVELQGEGWFLNYDYCYPHPVFLNQLGEYSGQVLVRLPSDICRLIGYPKYGGSGGSTPAVTAYEALEMLNERKQ